MSSESAELFRADTFDSHGANAAFNVNLSVQALSSGGLIRALGRDR